MKTQYYTATSIDGFIADADNSLEWLFRVEGPDIRFISGDVVPVHAEMVEAAAGQNVWLVGGGDLVGQFHDQGLLDEVILGVAPVFLGAGAPLLPRQILSSQLRLIDVTRHGSTFVTLRYAVSRS